MEAPNFIDMTVSAVVLTIAYLIVAKTLPSVVDRIMQEFKAKRDEFLVALENERSARLAERKLQHEFIRSEREAFIQALSNERTDHAKLRDEQNKLHTQAIERLQTHLDLCLVQISGRIGDLTVIVGGLTQVFSELEFRPKSKSNQKESDMGLHSQKGQ